MRTANELMINMDNAMIEFQAGRMAIGEFREVCRYRLMRRVPRWNCLRHVERYLVSHS